MASGEDGWARHLPLKPLVAAIMAELATGPCHGYGLMTRLDGFKGGRGVGPATLYRTLDQLVRDGWIEPADDGDASSRRGADYELTEAGRAVLSAEVARLETWARDARTALDPTVGR